MKPLNKPERWYAFLEIIFEGSVHDKLPFYHTDFGLLSDCSSIKADRMEEIDDHVEELWANPPETQYE